MPKTNKERVVQDTALQELAGLSLLLDSDPEVIGSLSIDDVRIELREMGLNPNTPLLRSAQDRMRASVNPQNSALWPKAPTPATHIKVFISYAHEDEELRDQFVAHLSKLERQGVITDWHGRMINAGETWAEEIDNHINQAQVILLLISPAFMASGYCYDREFERAMEKHKAGEALVIPVILRPADWKYSALGLGRFQALPTGAKPVTLWEDRDEAFLNVARGIQKSVTYFRERPIAAQPATFDQPTIATGALNHLSMESLREAICAVPMVKYALGVAGIGAAVTIVAGFSIDYKVAIFGTITMFCLIFCLVGFSSFAQRAAASIRPLALTLTWTFILLISATSLCISTGFFFSWPRPLEEYVGGSPTPQPSPTVAHTVASNEANTSDQSADNVSATRPSIQISVVPSKGTGPERMERIAGRVSGVNVQACKVVVFARTDKWYVQPYIDAPDTPIGADGEWENDTYLGSEYAALLVKASYKPPATTGILPDVAGPVLAVVKVAAKK